jgi:PAS domain S-box-containing protein
VVDASLIAGALEESSRPRIELVTASTLIEGLAYLERDTFDVVLVDLSAPTGTGADSLAHLRRVAPDVPCIALAAVTDEELAARALLEGAQDYLIKEGPYFAFLTRAIRYAIDRMRAELALRERERFFQLLIENVSDIIAVVDAKLTVRYVSPAIEHVCGIPPAEARGAHLSSLVHPEDLEIVAMRTASRLRGEGDPEAFTEVRARHVDGGWRWIQVRASRYDDPGGEPVIVVAARDITESRRLHEVLREAEPVE